MINNQSVCDAIKYFLRKDGKFNKRKFNRDNSIQKTILELNYKYDSVDELAYCINKNIVEKPCCPVCGKQLKFLISKSRFQNHCSNSCATKDENVQEKSKKTKLERYGDENYNNSKKMKETMFERYGCYGTFCNKSLKEKVNKTCLEKYGSSTYNNPNKTTETCKKRYGSGRNTSKIVATMNERYGLNYYLQSQEINKMRNCFDIQVKINASKLKNNSFNKSNSEDNVYIFLINKFGENDVFRQYSDERYPKNCDFYIKSLDLFIECNFHWTHGGHLFDSTNSVDVAKLNKWKEKAKTSRFYVNAINTWTVRDIEKFNIFNKNKLNFVIFYKEEDAYEENNYR